MLDVEDHIFSILQKNYDFTLESELNYKTKTIVLFAANNGLSMKCIDIGLVSINLNRILSLLVIPYFHLRILVCL